VLPSVWEAVAGTRAVEWGVERPDGKLEFTPEMARCWRWKDELPDRRLALVGKHFGRWAALVAPRLVPHVCAAAAERRNALTELQHEVAAAVREHGACTGPQLRELLGADKRVVDGSIVALQRALVLTNSQLVAQDYGWGAIAVDLVERRFPSGRLPAERDARRELARVVLAAAGELSAADLGGALGWRVRAAREALDELVEAGEANVQAEGGVTLFVA
jgi:Winged helix DNA-binding domain